MISISQCAPNRARELTRKRPQSDLVGYKFVVNITKPQQCHFIIYTDHITGKKVAQFSYLALEKQSNRNSIFVVKKHSLSTSI
jgi:hypothetical protein